MEQTYSSWLTRRVPRPLAALALLLTTVGATHAQTPATFAAVASYGSGGNQPISVAVADVNGDGKPDLLTTNLSGTVGVLLGTGTGSFGNVTTYGSGGGGPVYVAVADVNSDGKLDLLTTNYFSNNVGVLLGTGTGSFGNVTTYDTGGNQPNTVAVGDVNGDGKLDLLTTNHGSDNVGVLLGTGTGSFGTATTYSSGAGSQPASIAVADVDGDGQLDLLTANYGSSTVGVLLGTGTGSFGNVTTYGSGGKIPNSIAVADVNGDGKLDLLTANQGSDNVGVLLNTGTGSFGTATTYSSGAGSAPASLAVADVNGDGKPDLLTANSSINSNTKNSSVGVLLGTSTGSFGAVTTYSTGAGSQPSSIAVADVNGDGKPDLFTANRGSDNVGVLLNTTVYAPALTGISPNPAAVGQSLTLTGTNLTGATAVSFNGTAQTTITNNTATSLTVTVPTGATTGPVTVTTPGGTSNGLTFTVVVPPVISSFSPTSGVAGTPVTLTGTNLSGATSVAVNGVAVTPTNVTATSLSFVVPAGASATQSITVTTPGGTSAASTAFTVRLQVASTSPAANARTVPTANSATAVTFTEPVSAASAANVKVFSAQAGGRKAGTVTVSGSTANFAATASTPVTNFRPGEVVSVSVPATVLGAGGLPATKRVYQFTTATGGPGRGNFLPGSDPAVGSVPISVAVGDVDGDGDLDLLTANIDDNTVSVRLNNGSGTFSGGSDPAMGSAPTSVALGDVDGDGDLDLLTANGNDNTVSVRLNNGSGTFSGGSDPAVGSDPQSVALGDVDGDGDLDLLTANNGISYGTTVSVRLNDGSGTFGGGSDPAVGSSPRSVVVGDVDGDGDLDLLTANGRDNTVSLRLNDGSGTFSGGSNLAVGAVPTNVALGDVDGDGDLDLLTANGRDNTVSVRLNNGSGTFSGGSDPAVGAGPQSVALGDVDGDSDLDLLTANYSGTVSVRLNDGSGTFGGGSNPAVGSSPRSVAVGDVDGDGDLDLLTANYGNYSGNTVSVRLNQAPVPTLTAVSPAAELPGTVVTLTGTGFTAGSTVSFGGTAATGVTVGSATSLTVTVPASLAASSAPIVVSTAGGPSAALPFTALAVYTGGTLAACTAAVPATASLGDGAWHYLLSTGGQVVAAYQYTGASLGNLALDVLRADPAQPVRQDGNGRYYLDRNFHLTASAGRFDGRTVALRLYGLNTEQARLQLADPTATLANLKATQYSGPNEDCDLANNSASGERRTLAAPASSPAGTTYFVAQLSVADHFSEFYLTGSSTPLPVELTTFTATAVGTAAVRLAWATASELNSQAFDVERSLDGASFGRISTLAAAGSSSVVRSYEWQDAQLPAGAALLYYRLKQVDLNGTFSYSPVRAVTLKAARGLALFPNPATTGATLTGAVPGAAVTVLDAVGRTVLSLTADAAGAARLVLPVGSPVGVYVVRAGTKALRLTVE